jgi:hypothetical protein
LVFEETPLAPEVKNFDFAEETNKFKDIPKTYASLSSSGRRAFQILRAVA